jgi:hypothetical protein
VRDVTCCDVTQGSEDEITTSITLGIDLGFATKYSRSHLWFPFIIFAFFFIPYIADQYYSAFGNGLSSLAYGCTDFRSLVFISNWVSIPLLCPLPSLWLSVYMYIYIFFFAVSCYPSDCFIWAM